MALAAWFAIGAALELLESHAASEATNADRSVFVLAGNYRTLAADWLWLETNLAWERHDPAETRRLINLTVAADPGSRYYWLNGARMLAYDLPLWADEADPGAPAAVVRRRRERAVDEAIALLGKETGERGPCAAIEIEIANICLYGLEDRQLAASHYETAAKFPDAPAYAARIAARLREEGSR